MATSLVGPFLVDRASSAAPVPRPPQPTRASWMVWFSPAWTWGMAMPARAEAAAIWPDFFSRSRRDRPLLVGSLTVAFLRWLVGRRSTRVISIQYRDSGQMSTGAGQNLRGGRSRKRPAVVSYFGVR